MAGPIHKLFRVSLSDAWYQLTEDDRKSLLAKVNEAREKVGGKSIILCDSGWASEEWQLFGVETYPDIEAVQKFTELLREFEWFKYLKSDSLLGTSTSV